MIQFHDHLENTKGLSPPHVCLAKCPEGSTGRRAFYDTDFGCHLHRRRRFCIHKPKCPFNVPELDCPVYALPRRNGRRLEENFWLFHDVSISRRVLSIPGCATRRSDCLRRLRKFHLTLLQWDLAKRKACSIIRAASRTPFKGACVDFSPLVVRRTRISCLFNLLMDRP